MVLKIAVLPLVALVLCSLAGCATTTSESVSSKSSAYSSAAPITSDDGFRQALSRLQREPENASLREHIIRYALAMEPKPATPPEADIHEGRATATAKGATSQQDYAEAAKEYVLAALSAPWISSYYFNAALLFEKAGQLEQTKQNYQFYLLVAPNASDASDVRKHLGEMDYLIAQRKLEIAKRAKTDEFNRQFGFLAGKYSWRRVMERGDGLYNKVVYSYEADVVVTDASVDIYSINDGRRNNEPSLHGIIHGSDYHHIKWEEPASGEVPEQPVKVTIDKSSSSIHWRASMMNGTTKEFDNGLIRDETLTKVER